MQELLICIRDFTAAHLLRSASPATYLPSSPPPPPSCHFSLCSHGPAPPLVPACFKEGSRKAGRQKFSLSEHQLAITPEELANRSAADERQKWDRLLFINMVRGEVCVRVPVSECVRACTCVPVRGLKWATNCFIYTADKHPNTSMSWGDGETQRYSWCNYTFE